MCDQTTLKDLPSVTSSPVSVDGQGRLDLQGGQTNDQSGPEAVHASPSARPENEKVSKTPDICGPSGSTLSAGGGDFQSFLANRLVQQFPTDGSTECVLTWKQKVTPLGQPYCQLAASTRPIKETDYGSWPTPQTRDFRSGEAARWHNPDRSRNLNDAVKMDMATWATPNTMDYMDARSPDAMRKQFSVARKGRTAPANLREQIHPESYPAALWSSPKSAEATRTRTPHGAVQQMETRNSPNLSDQVVSLIASGLPTSGSSVVTGKRGVSLQLNPAFVFWLMGYPDEWVKYAPVGTQSSRKSRPVSSSPQIMQSEITGE